MARHCSKQFSARRGRQPHRGSRPTRVDAEFSGAGTVTCDSSRRGPRLINSFLLSGRTAGLAGEIPCVSPSPSTMNGTKTMKTKRLIATSLALPLFGYTRPTLAMLLYLLIGSSPCLHAQSHWYLRHPLPTPNGLLGATYG